MVVITLDQAAIRWAVCTAESSPTAALDRWLMQHPEAFRRIIIPAELKWQARDKLDQINITERVSVIRLSSFV